MEHFYGYAYCECQAAQGTQHPRFLPAFYIGISSPQYTVYQATGPNDAMFRIRKSSCLPLQDHWLKCYAPPV